MHIPDTFRQAEPVDGRALGAEAQNYFLFFYRAAGDARKIFPAQ
ncbi:hypothetical protein [Burkholderia multivorans]|nr:hypothetical protein [Burkholderia multivorans]